MEILASGDVDDHGRLQSVVATWCRKAIVVVVMVARGYQIRIGLGACSGPWWLGLLGSC